MKGGILGNCWTSLPGTVLTNCYSATADKDMANKLVRHIERTRNPRVPQVGDRVCYTTCLCHFQYGEVAFDAVFRRDLLAERTRDPHAHRFAVQAPSLIHICGCRAQRTRPAWTIMHRKFEKS